MILPPLQPYTECKDMQNLMDEMCIESPLQAMQHPSYEKMQTRIVKISRFMCSCTASRVCLSEFAICTSAYRITAGGCSDMGVVTKTRNISFHLSNIEQLISFRSVRSIRSTRNEIKRKMPNNKERIINLCNFEWIKNSIDICACEFIRSRLATVVVFY